MILISLFAGIAWLIIPQKWYMKFLSDTLEIASWRMFLAICSLPEFLACIALFAFPESPRFLILKGRHDEALNVFKKIYSLNTGKDPDTYPVRACRKDVFLLKYLKKNLDTDLKIVLLD